MGSNARPLRRTLNPPAGINAAPERWLTTPGPIAWPGWGDAVEIQAADVAEGLKLAERSFELAGELGLGDKAIGRSLWLGGALHMAAGRLSAAIAQFAHAEEAFQAAQLPVPAAMARGYVALAEKALPESYLRGAESLTAVLGWLRGMESRDHFQLRNTQSVMITLHPAPHVLRSYAESESRRPGFGGRVRQPTGSDDSAKLREVNWFVYLLTALFIACFAYWSR